MKLIATPFIGIIFAFSAIADGNKLKDMHIEMSDEYNCLGNLCINVIKKNNFDFVNKKIGLVERQKYSDPFSEHSSDSSGNKISDFGVGFSYDFD